jgi:hypothetical protein
MKPVAFRSVLRFAVAGVALAVGLSVHAATANETAAKTATTGKKKKAVAGAVVGARSTASAGAVGLLDEAYGALRIADHDYKGHRARAMHQIEDAARELGSKLSGGGRGDEKQVKSDSQLHSAQSLLQQAVGGVTGKAHHHVEEALKQLSIALSIK